MKLIESLPEGDQRAIKSTIVELRALDFVKDITFNERHTVTIEIVTDEFIIENREKSNKVYFAEYKLLGQIEGSLGVSVRIVTEDE